MKGKLIAFEKRMKGDVQETFSGSRGVLYKFNVTMEYNGIQETGEYASTKENPSWTIGEEYLFERTVRGASGQYISFSGLKKEDAGGGGRSYGGGKPDGMAFAKKKAAECAYRACEALWLSEKVEANMDLYHVPAKLFYDEIVKENNEQSIWAKVAAFDALIGYSKVVKMVAPEGVKMTTHWINTMHIFKTKMTSL